MNDTYAKKIIHFLSSLHLNVSLPQGASVMNPYHDDDVLTYCKAFYHCYYNDDMTRTLILGINPGRFGGGLTGIPFTDPITLEKTCGISNNFLQKKELSGDFIYRVIHAFGGPKKFYQRFYISSVVPLGFVQHGKNMNYYDHKALKQAVYPFIVQMLKKQMQFGLDDRLAFCLGEGKNFSFLSTLNQEHKIFKTIVPLPHPRFIMQYRRSQLDTYIAQYLDEFTKNEKRQSNQ